MTASTLTALAAGLQAALVTALGAPAYWRVYGAHREALAAARRDRRRRREVEAVVDPDAAAAKRRRKNEARRVAKQQKRPGRRPGAKL